MNSFESQANLQNVQKATKKGEKKNLNVNSVTGFYREVEQHTHADFMFEIPQSNPASYK